MKRNRLLCFLLAILLCFTLVSCSDDGNGLADSDAVSATEEILTEENASVPEVEQTDTVTPLLYRVTDSDGTVIWLFGSIHVGKEEYYPLPAYVMDAYNEADALAVEADIIAFEADLTAQVNALNKMLYRGGATIREHVPSELYERAKRVLKELDSYASVLDVYYPILWSNTIDTLLYKKMGVDFNLGIDRHLLNLAKETEKKVEEIESADSQYQMLAGFSEALQVFLLEQSVESVEKWEESEEALFELMAAWENGDEEKFAKLLHSEEEVTEEEKELYDEYNKAMLTNRNLLMTDYAENALKSNEEVFICVGSAHVVGKDAMADLLIRRGYKVEIVKGD